MDTEQTCQIAEVVVKPQMLRRGVGTNIDRVITMTSAQDLVNAAAFIILYERFSQISPEPPVGVVK